MIPFKIWDECSTVCISASLQNCVEFLANVYRNTYNIVLHKKNLHDNQATVTRASETDF